MEITKSLRASVFTALILLFAGLLVVAYFSLYHIMRARIETIENDEAYDSVDRALNIINQKKNTLAVAAADWAVWDDTYDFAVNGNDDYRDENLYEYEFYINDWNYFAIIGPHGDYVYDQWYDLEEDKFVPSYSGLASVIEESGILHNSDMDYAISGIIQVPEGLMLIASHPILTSSYDGPPNGNLVTARFLDDSLIQTFSEQVMLDISLKSMEGEKLGLITDQSIDSVLIQRINDRELLVQTTLFDVFNQPIAELEVAMDRNTYTVGMNGIRYSLYAIMAAGLIASIFIVLFLEKRIISRIVGLNEEVYEIGQGLLKSKRVKTQKETDEICLLAKQINIMLDKIEESEIDLRESHHNLEKLVEERTQELVDSNLLLESEIEERKKTEVEIKKMAYHDHLTGLPNRRMFNERLEQAIFLAKRMERTFGIIFIDIDSFKIVNDTMGHDHGDELLKEIANRLLYATRKSDTVCRVGGDEFIISVQNLASPEDILIIADKLINCLREPIKLKGQDLFVTASLGISMYPADGEDVVTLIKNADIAMYTAKEKGKNKYVLCTPVMKDKVEGEMNLTNHLYRALERNELMVYYQPQISCSSGKIVGVEALLRWKHPELGMIPPAKFIPIAEKTGLIIPIGEWIFTEACRQNVSWAKAGIHPIRTAVNISLYQLQHPDIMERVEKMLLETGMNTEVLEIEVTESVAMSESKQILDTLKQLKDLGISISIDDFGTEYSSLSRLKEMPVDRIKIAMPFIQGINVSEKDEAITKAIITLANNLGLHTIAEGVETIEQVSFLNQRMCEEIQGFYYYKPLPAHEVDEILRSDQAIGKRCDQPDQNAKS